MAALPADIAAHEARLADVNFYARDPSGFDATMKALDSARAKLDAVEEEWLELEAKREALVAG
jgi:ATP-binding cassette subfamily F protein uup